LRPAGKSCVGQVHGRELRHGAGLPGRGPAFDAVQRLDVPTGRRRVPQGTLASTRGNGAWSCSRGAGVRLGESCHDACRGRRRPAVDESASGTERGVRTRVRGASPAPRGQDLRLRDWPGTACNGAWSWGRRGRIGVCAGRACASTRVLGKRLSRAFFVCIRGRASIRARSRRARTEHRLCLAGQWVHDPARTSCVAPRRKLGRRSFKCVKGNERSRGAAGNKTANWRPPRGGGPVWRHGRGRVWEQGRGRVGGEARRGPGRGGGGPRGRGWVSRKGARWVWAFSQGADGSGVPGRGRGRGRPGRRVG